MNTTRISSSAAAIAVTAFLSIGAAQAAMSPASPGRASNVVPVDCAVGFHIGPLGTCVIGTDNPPPGPPPGAVIEHRATDEGCQTKSVRREDAQGNSETRTATNCP
jgi:hypothetical protein